MVGLFDDLLDAPAQSAGLFDDLLDDGKRPLLQGIRPSDADAGRGAADFAATDPRRIDRAPVGSRGGRRPEFRPFVAGDTQQTYQPDQQVIGDVTPGMLLNAPRATGVESQADLVEMSKSPALRQREMEEAAQARRRQQFLQQSGELKPLPEQSTYDRALQSTLAKPLDRSVAGMLLEGVGDAVRGVERSSYGMAGAAWSALQAGADTVGADDAARFAGMSGRAAREARDAAGNPIDRDSLTQQVFESTFTSVPLVLALGGGNLALAGIAGQAAANDYGESRDRGLTHEQAASRAPWMGIAEAVGERFGLPQLGQLFQAAASKATNKEMGKILADLLVKEQAGEQVTLAMQNLYEATGPYGTKPNLTLEQHLNEAVETAKVTLGQSLLTGGMSAGVRAISRKPDETFDYDSLARDKGFAAGAARPFTFEAPPARDPVDTILDPTTPLGGDGRLLNLFNIPAVDGSPRAAAKQAATSTPPKVDALTEDYVGMAGDILQTEAERNIGPTAAQADLTQPAPQPIPEVGAPVPAAAQEPAQPAPKYEILGTGTMLVKRPISEVRPLAPGAWMISAPGGTLVGKTAAPTVQAALDAEAPVDAVNVSPEPVENQAGNEQIPGAEVSRFQTEQPPVAPGAQATAAATVPDYSVNKDGTLIINAPKEALAPFVPDVKLIQTGRGTLVGRTAAAEVSAHLAVARDVPETFATEQEARALAKAAGMPADTEVGRTDGGYVLLPPMKVQTAEQVTAASSAVDRLSIAINRNQTKATGVPVELVPDAELAQQGPAGVMATKIVQAMRSVFKVPITMVNNLTAEGAYHEGGVYLDSGEITKGPGGIRGLLSRVVGVAMHEVHHYFENSKDPADRAVHAKLRRVMREYYKPGVIAARQATEQAQRTGKLQARYGGNEVRADLSGGFGLDGAFWGRLIELDNGSTARKVFYRFMQAMTRFIVVAKGNKFDVSALVTNKAASREAYAQAWASWLGNQGAKTGAGATQTLGAVPEDALFGKQAGGVADAALSQSAMKSVEANVRRGTAAMNKALLEKADQHRAMFRTGLGWVDFAWGDSRRGIQHIIERRMQEDGLTRQEVDRMLTTDIIEAVAKGEELRRREGDTGRLRLVLEHNGHEAVLVRNPGNNGWLLTGYQQKERLPGEEARSATRSSPTLTAPIRSRDNQGAGNEESLLLDGRQEPQNPSDNVRFSQPDTRGEGQTGPVQLSQSERPPRPTINGFRDDRNLGPRRSNEDTISTRVPTSVDPAENAIAEKLSVGIGVVAANKALISKHADLVAGDPILGQRASGASDEAIIDAFVERLKDNLLFLYDSVDESIRLRSRNWYNGANAIAGKLADLSGVSRRAAAGALAALSPQTPWDVNVSQAGRVVFIWKNHQDTSADAVMDYWFQVQEEKLDAAGKPTEAMSAIRNYLRGKTLREVDDRLLKAWWLRAYDETHHDRSYWLVAPEGLPVRLMAKKDGSPSNMPWGNTDNIAKALAILDDDSIGNLSEQLGVAHKVRSFYNNIIAPSDPGEHVTIDTHAVAAARLEPLSGSSAEVAQAWGGKGSSAVFGQNGLYGEYAEAYRRAAAERGILPREMQSVTWEAVRGLFPDTWKTRGSYDEIRAIWVQHQGGAISASEARERIVARTPAGVAGPNWSEDGRGGAQETGAQGDQGQRGRDAGPGVVSLSQSDPATRYAGVIIEQPILIEDTGQTATLRIDAGQAIADLDERALKMRRLLDCLG